MNNKWEDITVFIAAVENPTLGSVEDCAWACVCDFIWFATRNSIRTVVEISVGVSMRTSVYIECFMLRDDGFYE